MHRLEIKRENGGLVRRMTANDGVVALLFYVPEASKSAIAEATGSKWAEGDIVRMASKTDVESSGLATLTDWHARMIKMHLERVYKQNGYADLYVGVYADGAHSTYSEVEAMQRYAGGEIRVMGIWEGGVAPSATIVKALQAVADKLEGEQMPLSIVWSCGGSLATYKSTNMRAAGQKNVSVVVAQDGDDGLYGDSANSENPGIVGLVVGMLSKAPVNESVSWVERYPTGIETPCLGDGTPMREVALADAKDMDKNGYIFLTLYPGIAGSYLSDTHTMDEATSDYAHIEDERTMDKAVRGVYAELVRALGGKVYADAEGRLREDSRAMIEDKASATIEAMERAGELSGYSVEVSGDSVLSDGVVKVVIKCQPTGVVRVISVSIGYATEL